jgi:diguanylate cyclase (GGDEF)-like protein
MSPAPHRTTLLVIAAVSYGLVTAAFITIERPGLGLGHLYYVPIVLVAFASGPVLGGLAGVVGAILYNVGIMISPRIPSTFEFEQTVIRLIVYTGIGVLIGFFARRNRSLLAQMSQLAERDSVTGLPNTRAFQRAIERRLATTEPFTLLVGDIDELRRANVSGRERGDDALRHLADRLVTLKRIGDDVARVGGDEFAVLATLDAGADSRTLAIGTENQLRLWGEAVTFGWATYPQDGTNALALYSAAEERLYARKVARGLRRDDPVPALA